MDDKEAGNLLPVTLTTIASSVAAYREEAWNMTKAMDVRLAAFERNVEKSDGSDLRTLTEEALRISARARLALGSGMIEPTVKEYVNTSALLDPRGYDAARRDGRHTEFQYDPAKVVVSETDQRIIDSPRPITSARGPQTVEAALPTLSTGFGR